MLKTSDILAAVEIERRRQDLKWGQQNHDDGRWTQILVEELGEAAKHSLENTPGQFRELVQAAAVIVAWCEAIGRRPLAC